MTESVSSTSAATPVPESELEGCHLYAVLDYRGEPTTWNWAFFIPDPSVSPIGTSGTVFHVVHLTEESGSFWKFTREKRDVLSSPFVVAIIRLADVSDLGKDAESIVSDALLPMFRQVDVPVGDSARHPEFNSRTWFLDAVTVLNDCAVLTCNDIWNLEREIRRNVFAAMDKYYENKGWTIYHAENCS